MKKIYQFSMLALIIMLSLSFSACSSDDDVSEVIPAGTYIEENGNEAELFSFVASGNTIRWTCTVYGEVESVIETTYTINKNQITVVSKEGTETGYYKRDGKRVTIGEITYIKQ